MFKNYLKIGLRNLLRNWSNSIINILGLAIGLTCVLFLTFHIKDELNYDQGFSNADRIYRVTNENLGQNARHWAATPAPMGPEIKSFFPEIETSARLQRPFPFLLLSSESPSGERRQFEEKGGYFADKEVIDMFDLEFMYGNSQTALDDINTIVLSEEMAFKYFGKIDVIGKRIRDNNGDQNFIVKGVIRDFSFNTHLKIDFLLSMPTLTNYIGPDAFSSRGWAGFYTYVLLKPNISVASINEKLQNFNLVFYGRNGETPEKILASRLLHLQPITAIHLHSKLEKEMSANSDVTYVYIFSFIAFFILLLAMVNFINLSTVQSLSRMKEIGMRKVSGGTKGQIITQFMMESFITCLISFILALVLFKGCLPIYESMTLKHFSFNIIFNFSNSIVLAGLIFIVGILAGLYPAWLVSRFDTIRAIKNNANIGVFRGGLRNALIVFQFVVAIFMIISTIIIFEQLNLFHHKNLGFDRDQIVTVTMYRDILENFRSLSDKMSQNPSIESFSMISTLPGERFSSSQVKLLGTDVASDTRIMWSDDKILGTLGVQLKAGRNFFKARSTSSNQEVLVNQATIDNLSLINPIGKRLSIGGVNEEVEIVGIVEDFNFASLHSKIEPLVIVYNPSMADRLIVKVKANTVPQTITFLENSIKQVSPSSIFSYTFLNERLEQLYSTENRMSSIFKIFAFLCIFISCLGLYGISSYAFRMRVKEIGIRKVLGASIFGIMRLISTSFIKLIIISIFIATPLAYICMHRWLENFNYHIEIHYWIYLISGVGTLALALTIMSFQAIGAAITNPIKCLRTE